MPVRAHVPQVKHPELLKHIARYLVNKEECAWKFPEQKPPTKIVAYQVSNEEDQRSVDTVPLFFGRALFETSTCTQQVTALSSGESEFYGVLRGSTSALQVRHVLLEMNTEMEVDILTDSSAARGMLRRSRSGRVKHLEARWLWPQERTRAKEPHVGTVDTTLNGTDLGTKLHPRRRCEELLMMLPLRIGVWLIPSYGAEGLSMDRADSENRDVSFIDKLSLSTWWICRGMEISIGLLLGRHCVAYTPGVAPKDEDAVLVKNAKAQPVPGVIMRFGQSPQLAVQPSLPMLSALLWNLSAFSSFILCVLHLAAPGCAPTNLSVRRKSQRIPRGSLQPSTVNLSPSGILRPSPEVIPPCPSILAVPVLPHAFHHVEAIAELQATFLAHLRTLVQKGFCRQPLSCAER